MTRELLQSIPLAIVASTPLLLAVQGELVVQRAGMINLGVEGMMLTAALAGTIAAQATGSVTIGFIAGIAGALTIAAIFALPTIARGADQIVSGTAVNLLALGVTGVIYREMQMGGIFTRPLPRLPVDVVVPLAWIVVPIALGLVLWNTSFGLRLRACGENPDVAASHGFSVARYRLAALAIEAVLAGIAGAYLAIELSSGFAENMTAGRGFIALSIVIFGRWRVSGALIGTAIFGVAAATQYALQAASSNVPFQLLLAIPYVVTLLILCGVTGRVRGPEALGR